MSQIVELYGIRTESETPVDWAAVIQEQHCPYTASLCSKIRKSTPDITIGSCTVLHGRQREPVIICPKRLLERRQIFMDCLHLLTLHQPGNELHVVPEITLPGGSVDYFLVSVRNGQAIDFVGIELQALDTTGTVWPARQRFLADKGVALDAPDSKPYGMNWKMTAKTTLIQLNHKIETFENLRKHLVLVMQGELMAYMRRQFRFDHLNPGLTGDAMQFHVYQLAPEKDHNLRLNLQARFSTDAAGVAQSLGLQSNPNLTLNHFLTLLEAKLSASTLLTI
jgi:hypothetical protein